MGVSARSGRLHNYRLPNINARSFARNSNNSSQFVPPRTPRRRYQHAFRDVPGATIFADAE